MAEVRQMPCPPGNTRIRDLPPALRLPRALSRRAVPIPLSGRKPAPSRGDHTTQSSAVCPGPRRKSAPPPPRAVMCQWRDAAVATALRPARRL